MEEIVNNSLNLLNEDRRIAPLSAGSFHPGLNPQPNHFPAQAVKRENARQQNERSLYEGGVHKRMKKALEIHKRRQLQFEKYLFFCNLKFADKDALRLPKSPVMKFLISLPKYQA